MVRPVRVVRVVVLGLLLASALQVAFATEDDETAEQKETEEVAPEAEATDPVATEEAAEEPEAVELNCLAPELIEPLHTWSVDCAAKWMENMGFGDTKNAILERQVDGPGLALLTLTRLAEDYGISDEDDRKMIVYALKDIVRKDDYKGNINNWSEFFMWILPFLGIYKWLTMRYERQIERYTKKYRKWQEVRNPPEPAAPVVTADGLSEWIEGMNTDVVGGKEKKTKKLKTPKAD
jgi:hypothetical protein